MAGGTAVAARAAPTAANPATDAKADDAAMARAKPKVDAAALLAGVEGPMAGYYQEGATWHQESSDTHAGA